MANAIRQTATGHENGGKAIALYDGAIDMRVDESEVHLEAADVMVQQGTNHGWVNRGQTVGRVAFASIDAEEPAELREQVAKP